MDPARAGATTDVCVPLSRLPDLVAAAEARAAAARIKVYTVAHAGDGNVHHFIAFDKEDAAEVAEAHAFNAFLVKTAQDMDGTCTGEHGVGFGKLGFVERELGAPACDAMKKIKNALDPLGILNPGKKGTDSRA
jgi:D-lactate dehydrogenase (cytochrome)